MCGCILALLALAMPRLVLAVIWLVTGWFGQAYDSVLWPLLGWFFMPYTTAAYMATMLNNNHQVSTGWLVLIILAALVDLGAYRSGQVTVRGWAVRPRSEQ
jgi:cytochrome b561